MVDSLLASADCFLACRKLMIQALAEAALSNGADRDPAVRARLTQSTDRLRAFRATLATPPAEDGYRRLPLDAHAQLATKLHDGA